MENTFDDEFDLGVTLNNREDVYDLVSDYIRDLGFTRDQGNDFAGYLKEVYDSLPLHERKLVMNTPQIIMTTENIQNTYYIIRCRRSSERILANYDLSETRGIDGQSDIRSYIIGGIERYFHELSDFCEFERELQQHRKDFQVYLITQHIGSRIRIYHESVFDRDRTRRTLERIRADLVIERSTEVLEEFVV